MSGQPNERAVGGQPSGPTMDWDARWVAKFQVYHQRRFGTGAAVTPVQVGDFLRFIACAGRRPIGSKRRRRLR